MTPPPASSPPASPPPASSPPVARVAPVSRTVHGITLTDPYPWLRDPAYPDVVDPEVLGHLRAENAWFEEWMRPHAGLVERIHAELKGRVAPDEASVPYADGDFLYGWRFDDGAQYRNWYRTPRAGGPEQLILSEPALAEGRDYFRLGVFAVSPDGRWLAYSHDSSGDERFTLVVRCLETMADVATVAADALGDVVWSADSAALLWVRASKEWRPVTIFCHRLGSAPGADTLLYHEEDPVWRVGVGRTQDRRFLLIMAEEFDSTEVRLVDAFHPEGPRTIVRERKKGVRYEVDSSGDTLFILTNDDHSNFRVATAAVAKPGEWSPLIAGSDDHYLRRITAFGSFLAIEERVDGLDQVRLRSPSGDEHRVAFSEQSYTVSLGPNAEPDTARLRLHYSSMVTPDTVFDYEVATRRLLTRKVREIPSGYDPADYVTERLLAPARDGALVPVSVVYRKGYRKDGSQPLHCYGYGAYGHAIAPSFSAARLSLVDRGFAYAILHIRGGDDLGHRWYQDGKMDRRANAFNDFLDATHHLNACGFGRPGWNSASGGSAGGWLMGVVVNAEPELWRAVVAHVPFVDVLNTMLDDSLPLTPGEFPEWGNPAADPEVFARLLRLSPYENVRAADYPAMLVTAGLHDPRVTYWEPAKWVARLRAAATGGRPLLLKTNMEAGHGGKSGRFEALRETAEEYAFLLAAFGMA